MYSSVRRTVTPRGGGGQHQRRSTAAEAGAVSFFVAVWNIRAGAIKLEASMIKNMFPGNPRQ